MDNKQGKGHFSTTEIAHLLGVSRIAIFKKIKEGKIRAEKVGRNYIVPHEELNSILGIFVTPNKKNEIEKIVKKAVERYHPTFRRLGRE